MARLLRFLLAAWDLVVFLADVATLPFRVRRPTLTAAGETARLQRMTMVDVYQHAAGLRPAGE
jgi:hypothetical protein